MAFTLWILSLILSSLTSSAFCATPRRPVDVPFGRNYVPTWAFDHIKSFNGDSEIQLLLDQYTGVYTTCSLVNFYLEQSSIN
jgi:xyloglucan:xyloglucosyl transferase